MPTGKNQTFVYTTIGVLLIFTLLADNPIIYGACLHSPFVNRLTFHCFHANFFHFLANAYALYLIRPNPTDMLKAFPIAVASSFFTDTPTIGISAMIYAYIGMNVLKWNVSRIDWYIFIGANLASALLPNIAFAVHLAAFVIGIITFKTIETIGYKGFAFGKRA